MRRTILALALTLAVPGAADAADPERGTVSAASPKVEWTGTLQNPYLLHNLYNYEGTTAGAAGTLPCQAPMCDTFTLEVAEGGSDLLVELSSEQSPDISARIQDPSGAWTYHDGWSDGAPATRIRLKKAAKGTYVLNVVARVFGSTNPTAVTDTAEYKGSASLAVAPPAVAVPLPVVAEPPAPGQPASKPAAKKKKKPSAKAKCRRKAKRIKSKRKRRAAMKRCARKRG